MAEIDGGRIAARQLAALGIDHLFGVVAGPMIEVFAGAQAEGLRVVGGRLELNSGFMASAWGWQKKKPGILVAGSGPAVTNCLTPLYVATESAMPLVVFGGSAYSNTTGFGAFQELDQVAVAKPVAKWTGRVDSPERIGEWVRLAVGKALEGRPGGVYLDFPGEVVAARIEEESAAIRPMPEITAPEPDSDAVARVADLLESAERPLLLIGKGAAWADAGPALEKLASLGIPYVCSPMARGTIPDDHPNFANAARSTAIGGADVVVMFGGRFNWIFGMGRRFASDAKIIQVDVEAEEMVSGAELEIGLVADAKATADALLAAIGDRPLQSAKGGWLSSLQEQARRNEEGARAVLGDDSIPINPYRVVAEVKDALPRDAIVTAEGETIMGICRAMLPSYGNRSRLNAGTTGCMGVGAPYTVGSALAHPDRLSVGILGDYAFGAAAMVVETAARVGAKPVFVVVNNEGIAGHMLQDAFFPPGSPPIASLLPARYDKIAEMVDAHAEHVESPGEIRPALDRALASGKLAVVHVQVDPKATRISGSNYLQ
ncbi:MAG: thiamine pyrophosphate-binding protein [Deltaproteobacteria bacterium]|jgi:thiamine pyrophosphate-dependent acetolactate synthase large subunit-like protein|nr:thiamine pyrophosphate-binding protein [Deltaproteobacteria bacterium]